MDDESYVLCYFRVDGNNKVIISLKITQQQRMSCFFARPSSHRKFCCGWLPKNEKIVFWPDLAFAHYAKDTLVVKEESPPNVPQIRQIKFFWTNLKTKVYSNNYRPKDVQCLMAKIRKNLKSIETTGIYKTMKEIAAKAQKAHILGVAFFFFK
jgi:hypothetical protein